MSKKSKKSKKGQHGYVPYVSNFDFSTGSMKPKKSSLLAAGETATVPATTPRVLYKPEVWAEIQYYVAQQRLEVGWLGMVEKVGNDYLITEVYLPEQVVHAAETDISADAMTKIAMEILDAGKCSSQLYYWGHSHVNMQVSPSVQDEEQIDEFLKACPLFIRGIYNKLGDSKVDVYDVKAKTVYECVQNGPQPYALDDAKKLELDALMLTNVVPASRTIVAGNTQTQAGNVSSYMGYDYPYGVDDYDDGFNYGQYSSNVVAPVRSTAAIDATYAGPQLVQQLIDSPNQASPAERTKLISYYANRSINRAHLYVLMAIGSYNEATLATMVKSRAVFSAEERATIRKHVMSYDIYPQQVEDLVSAGMICKVDYLNLVKSRTEV